MTYDYANRLSKLSGERHRLTKQLQGMISEVAETICNAVGELKSVEVPGVGTLSIVEIKTNMGWPWVLMIDGWDAGEPYGVVEGHVLNYVRQSDTDFYLYGDFHAQLHVATTDEYLAVANHLPEVIQAFEIDQENIIKKLQGAFERLRQMSQFA